MTVKTGQTWSGLVVCKDATGALATPSVGPAGALYVDGVVNVASVTISGANPYKWTVTLPALTAGQCVSMYITATIATIATASVVAEDVADTYVASDVQAIVGHTDYGNAKLVRATTPANTLDVAAGGEASVNVTYLKDVALTETGAGYLAAGFKKLFDVEVPRLTVASYNLTSDAAATLSRLFSMLDALPSGVPDEDYYRWNAASLELVIGADSDTLETLSDQLDAIKLITDALDVTAVTQVAASSAGHLTITAALTFSEAVTGLTIPADWETAIWTLKASASQADTAALARLRTTNPADPADGLEWLNGAAVATPITAADGTLTVTQASGQIDIWLSDELTALLAETTGIGWDVKFVDADGDSIGQRGTADVVLTETWLTE